MKNHLRVAPAVAGLLLALGAYAQSGTKAFVGARLIDGSGKAAIANATLVVRDGKVVAAGPAASVKAPAGAQTVNLAGKTIIPGLVNSHGHMNDQVGGGGAKKSDDSAEANLLRQLGVYGRDGITTVWSLGGEPD